MYSGAGSPEAWHSNRSSRFFAIVVSLMALITAGGPYSVQMEVLAEDALNYQ